MAHRSVLSRARRGIAASAISHSIGSLARLSLLLPLVAVLAGCGGHPEPAALPGAGAQAPPPEAEYRLHVGDELNLMVVGQPEFSRIVKVRPDGRLDAPGVGEIEASGRTVAEVTEEVRTGLRRLIRYPEVSMMLTTYAALQVYVFGEVKTPGAHPYVQNMTALHAIGAAAGPMNSGKLSGVVVLRRTGPNALDVYPVNLDQALDGDAAARDLYLQPYDVVFVPRTFIADLNLFVDRFIRQNIAPFTAYIVGWQALHVDELYWRVKASE